MTRWWFGINHLIGINKLIGKAQLHCPGISRNVNNWAVVLVSCMVRVPLLLLTPEMAKHTKNKRKLSTVNP